LASGLNGPPLRDGFRNDVTAGCGGAADRACRSGSDRHDHSLPCSPHAAKL